jgi:hypothetical protein
MIAITLTQDSYRLWARIGPSISNTYGGVTVTLATGGADGVDAQLAQLNAISIVNEQY